MVAEILFVGVPAYVGRVDSATKCAFWAEVDGKFTFDPARLIAVDLAMNPVALQPSDWGKVQVDADYDDGGLTTIGPRFNVGMHVGAVYLTQQLFDANKASIEWPPYQGDANYQYQMLLRVDAAGKRARFSGFKAEVLASKPPLVEVTIFRAGDKEGSGPYWLDLTDPSVCDPTYSKITPKSPVGTKDALFLTWNEISILEVNLPKLPPGAGEGPVPGPEALRRAEQKENLARYLIARASIGG